MLVVRRRLLCEESKHDAKVPFIYIDIKRERLFYVEIKIGYAGFTTGSGNGSASSS